MGLSIHSLLQSYLWRWDIEINFRDQKSLLGVGEAQVRHPRSVQNQPAMAVAAYGLLLLAAAQCNLQALSQNVSRPPRSSICYATNFGALRFDPSLFPTSALKLASTTTPKNHNQIFIAPSSTPSPSLNESQTPGGGACASRSGSTELAE